MIKNDTKIVFIGAGRMASAIIRGLIEKEHYKPMQIACTCGNDSTGAQLAKETKIQYLEDIINEIHSADTIVLACKPQQFNQIKKNIVDATNGKLVLSILAGIRLNNLSEKFKLARNTIRTMPNTPGQIGAGVTAYCPQSKLSIKDQKIVDNILGSLGNFHEVKETDLDTVTALSGSGPAYLFEFAAALNEAAINNGLDPELASALTNDTLLGASMLLASSNESPEQLREAVSSPAGTTAAALEVLSKSGFRDLIDQVISAAKKRSIELSEE